MTEVGSVVVVWPVEDCWHAAKAENDAPTTSQVDRREAARPRSVVAVERNERRMLSNRESRAFNCILRPPREFCAAEFAAIIAAA